MVSCCKITHFFKYMYIRTYIFLILLFFCLKISTFAQIIMDYYYGCKTNFEIPPPTDSE